MEVRNIDVCINLLRKNERDITVRRDRWPHKRRKLENDKNQDSGEIKPDKALDNTIDYDDDDNHDRGSYG